MHDQLVSVPGHLPVNELQPLHVADLFGEATLEASANDVTRKQGNEMHSKLRHKTDDRPILTRVGQSYDLADAATQLADESERTPAHPLLC